MKELFNHDAVQYILVILVVLLGATALRFAAVRYANSKVSLVMLAVEKKLSTWATQQASSGYKRREAIELVSNKVYPLLPVWVKLFITKEQAVVRIDYLYSEMLDILDDGKNNNSIK